MPQQIKVSELEGARVETGAVQFTYPSGEQDWPGLFIRGDNAIGLMMSIENLEHCLNSTPGLLTDFYMQELRWIKNLIQGEVIMRPKGPDADPTTQGTT